MARPPARTFAVHAGAHAPPGRAGPPVRLWVGREAPQGRSHNGSGWRTRSGARTGTQGVSWSIRWVATRPSDVPAPSPGRAERGHRTPGYLTVRQLTSPAPRPDPPGEGGSHARHRRPLQPRRPRRLSRRAERPLPGRAGDGRVRRRARGHPRADRGTSRRREQLAAVAVRLRGRGARGDPAAGGDRFRRHRPAARPAAAGRGHRRARSAERRAAGHGRRDRVPARGVLPGRGGLEAARPAPGRTAGDRTEGLDRRGVRVPGPYGTGHPASGDRPAPPPSGGRFLRGRRPPGRPARPAVLPERAPS